MLSTPLPALFKTLTISTVSSKGHAVDPEVGAKVLLEGNYFNSVWELHIYERNYADWR